MDVVSLLQSKNRCLSRFLEISITFQGAAEAGDLSEIGVFLSRRDAILKTVELYDRKIDEAVAAIPPEERGPELVTLVKTELDARFAFTHQILRADERIMQLVEREKARVLAEMSNANRDRKQMTKFKSTWVREGGEELDTKL